MPLTLKIKVSNLVFVLLYRKNGHPTSNEYPSPDQAAIDIQPAHSGSLIESDVSGHLIESDINISGHLDMFDLSKFGHLNETDLSKSGHLNETDLSKSGHLNETDMSKSGLPNETGLSKSGFLNEIDMSMPGQLNETNTSQQQVGDVLEEVLIEAPVLNQSLIDYFIDETPKPNQITD